VTLSSPPMPSLYQLPLVLKTETFDTNPNWDARNNRAADPGARQIVQNFGFSSSSTNAGGAVGEIGGFITPAGEPAYYGKVITPVSFTNTLSASGMINMPQGGGHTLIGFFNAETVNEWRTPNTIVLRIYGRGTYFYAYLEYGTGLWRAGGTAFGGEAASPSGAATYPFSLNYDPNGAGGLGTISATFGSYSNVMTLDAGHKADGAVFNRFGILNVMKSADDPGQIWLDNITINGQSEAFNSDPVWDELNNRNTYISSNVRPRFDFGYSPGSNFAGGQSEGEIGGRVTSQRPGIGRVVALAHEHRRHSIRPDMLDRRQQPQLVVDHDVVLRRVPPLHIREHVFLVDVNQDRAIDSAPDPGLRDLSRLKDGVTVRQDGDSPARAEPGDGLECAGIEAVFERVVDQEQRHLHQARLVGVLDSIPLERAEVVRIAKLGPQGLEDLPVPFLGFGAECVDHMLAQIGRHGVVVEQRVVNVKKKDDSHPGRMTAIDGACQNGNAFVSRC